MTKTSFAMICLWLRTLAFSTVLLFSSAAFAQDTRLDAINKKAYALSLDSTAADKELSFLSKELQGKTVVAIGEASHGTHEFYALKTRMIDYLVRNCGFKAILFEFQKNMIDPLNTYLQSGKGDLKALMQGMALYNTKEIYSLFERMRKYNIGKDASERITLAGVDREEYWGDPIGRDKQMAANLINYNDSTKRKAILWTHNVHALKDTTIDAEPMGYHLKQHFGDKFYVMVFDTYQGTVNVLNNGAFEAHDFKSGDDGLTGLLARAGHKVFYLPVHGAANPLGTEVRKIMNIYSNWQEPKPLPVRPGVDFDAIIFVKDTSASVKLE